MKKLIASLLAPFIAGAVGAAATSPNITPWYASLAKPSLNPPANIFSIVWPILYLLMGISLYLVWSKGNEKETNLTVRFFWRHLLFNALWSVSFFALQSPFLGLVNIIVLDILVVILIGKFYKIEKKAGYLLAPYLVWILFATYLNFGVWYLNR